MNEELKMRIILGVRDSENDYAIFTFGGEDDEDCFSWISEIMRKENTGFHHCKDVDGFIQAIAKGQLRKTK